MLLLFYLNIKSSYNYTLNQSYQYIFILYLFIYLFLVNYYIESDNNTIIDISIYGLLDNYYEAYLNTVSNDLFGFSISYFILNGVEFLLIGFLLLIGSVICVNLYQMNKNVRAQSHSDYLTVFSFFTELTGFFFFKKTKFNKTVSQ